MKKALSLLLALVMCLSLCACGNNKDSKDTKAVVNNLYGETEHLSAKDLISVYEENEAKVKANYHFVDATIVGTVESVSTEWDLNPNKREEGYVITLAEGWVIGVMADDHEEVINLSKGDKIKVSSRIQYCTSTYVYMQYTEGQIDGSALDLSKIELE